MDATERKARLKKLSGNRVNRADDALRLVGNLVNYRPTPSQVDQILSHLNQRMKEITDQLRGVKMPKPEGFSLVED